MEDDSWKMEIYSNDFFCIRYRKIGNYWIDFEVHKIIAKEEDDRYIFADERYHSSIDALEKPSYSPIEGGHILCGHLKWDGCMNIQQTNTNCMMHFCGIGFFLKIAQSINKLYSKMGEI